MRNAEPEKESNSGNNPQKSKGKKKKTRKGKKKKTRKSKNNNNGKKKKTRRGKKKTRKSNPNCSCVNFRNTTGGITDDCLSSAVKYTEFVAKFVANLNRQNNR